MSEFDIETIEVSMEEARKVIADGEAFERLRQNPDFERIIHEMYFKEEPNRLVMLKSDMNMQGPTEQEQIIKDIDSIGRFRQFLVAVRYTHQQALQTVADCEEELETLRAEDAA